MQPHKQAELIGSIFPENLIIENNECRTARENEVILALKGFERDFKKENPTGESGFPAEYPGRDLNPHNLLGLQDFKSCVSTNFTTRASK